MATVKMLTVTLFHHADYRGLFSYNSVIVCYSFPYNIVWECTCDTHSIAMPQCLPALSPAAWKPERPIRATVGVMVRGPMYFNNKPGRPSAPTHTSTREDTIIAP